MCMSHHYPRHLAYLERNTAFFHLSASPRLNSSFIVALELCFNKPIFFLKSPKIPILDERPDPLVQPKETNPQKMVLFWCMCVCEYIYKFIHLFIHSWVLADTPWPLSVVGG